MEKIDFYEKKKKEYLRIDNETEVRYMNALNLAGISKQSSILDIGCKFAILNSLLKKKNMNAKYYGIDLLKDILMDNPYYDPNYFKVADVSKEIPFPNNFFDYIFALEIMEHVESPTFLIKEVKRVLKHDGKLILSVPNPYCFWEILANITKKPDTEGHISSFTHQTVSRLLDFLEMEIIDYCGTTMRIPYSRRLNMFFFNKNQYIIFKANNIFMSRSFIYKVINKDKIS